jgi:hypothetical protein
VGRLACAGGIWRGEQIEGFATLCLGSFIGLGDGGLGFGDQRRKIKRFGGHQELELVIPTQAAAPAQPEAAN